MAQSVTSGLKVSVYLLIARCQPADEGCHSYCQGALSGGTLGIVQEAWVLKVETMALLNGECQDTGVEAHANGQGLSGGDDQASRRSPADQYNVRGQTPTPRTVASHPAE